MAKVHRGTQKLLVPGFRLVQLQAYEVSWGVSWVSAYETLSVFPCFSVKSVLQIKRIYKSNIIIPQLGTGFRPSCSTSNSSLLPGKIAEDGPDTWVPANTWEPQPGFPGPGPHPAVMAIGK